MGSKYTVLAGNYGCSHAVYYGTESLMLALYYLLFRVSDRLDYKELRITK